MGKKELYKELLKKSRTNLKGEKGCPIAPGPWGGTANLDPEIRIQLLDTLEGWVSKKNAGSTYTSEESERHGTDERQMLNAFELSSNLDRKSKY